jgi:hypothetical protein
MIVASVAFNRADHVLIQRAASAVHLPEHTFIVAAHPNAPLRQHMTPDFDLEYLNSSGWPDVFLEAVDQLKLWFEDEDLLIMESDIFPLAGCDHLFDSNFIRVWGPPYPGLSFYKAGDTSKPKHLNWRFAKEASNVLDFDHQNDFTIEEVIDGPFFHFNCGDKRIEDSMAVKRAAVYNRFAKYYGVSFPSLEPRVKMNVGDSNA